MSTNDGEVPIPASRPARLPLRARLIAVFRFSGWFSKRSSRRSCEKKRSSSRTKTDATGAQRKARSGNEQSAKHQSSRKNVKEAAHPQRQEQQKPQQLEHHITSISSKPSVVPRAKIANYEPPKPYTSRRIGSISGTASRNYSGPISALASRNYSVAGSMHNSGIRSVPVSGELTQAGYGPPKIVRSSSKSLSKLRDQYVRAMMKLGDMADSVAIGSSVNFESQVFESEVIRKRSLAENEVMDYYLNSSIQPDEWKDARMGSRIIRNGAIAV